jgi:hypothetical protein
MQQAENDGSLQNALRHCQRLQNLPESARPRKIYVVFDFFISFLEQFPSSEHVKVGRRLTAGKHARPWAVNIISPILRPDSFYVPIN